MRFAFENRGEQLGGQRPHRLGPADQARGWPSQIFLMGFGTMRGHGGRFVRLWATGVGGNPLTTVVDFDGVGGRANLHPFSLQLIGDAVVVANGWRFALPPTDRKSTRLNSSHVKISYAV